MIKMTLFFSILLSFTANAQMPPFLNVKSVQIDGSGCDAGSANAIMSSDLSFLSVLYDRFSVEIGNGTANPGSRSAEKNCAVNVIVEVPAGWNFQFDSVDYRGFAQIPNKMTLAYQLISAEVYGGRGIAFDQNIIRGPRNENFVTTVRNKGTSGLNQNNRNPLDKLTGILSALGGIKNAVDNLSSGSLMGCSSSTQDVKIKIKSVIGVRNLLADITKPAVRLVVDSTDSAFRQNLHLSWKQCR